MTDNEWVGKAHKVRRLRIHEDLLNPIDTYAKHEGIGRNQAIRRLVYRGLVWEHQRAAEHDHPEEQP